MSSFTSSFAGAGGTSTGATVSATGPAEVASVSTTEISSVGVGAVRASSAHATEPPKMRQID